MQWRHHWHIMRATRRGAGVGGWGEFEGEISTGRNREANRASKQCQQQKPFRLFFLVCLWWWWGGGACITHALSYLQAQVHSKRWQEFKKGALVEMQNLSQSNLTWVSEELQRGLTDIRLQAIIPKYMQIQRTAGLWLHFATANQSVRTILCVGCDNIRVLFVIITAGSNSARHEWLDEYT